MAGPLTFRSRHRISRANDYRAAYAARLRKAAGPLVVFARRNGLPDHRLGLAVGRPVGHAVVRSRVKRLLREAFRLARPELPRGPGDAAYDLVVRVRAHDLARLPDYRRWLTDAAHRVAREDARRGAAEARDG